MTIKDFTRQVTPIKDRLFRFALRIVDNAAMAEDVVQEVLIKLWNKREELPKIDNLEAWSIRLTRNLSIDKLRSKHQKTESIKEHLEVSSADRNPLEITEGQDMMRMIHQLIQTLPEKQRLVIQLRDVEGMTYQEISEILEISLSQVKVNLYRARQFLKTELTKNNVYGL